MNPHQDLIERLRDLRRNLNPLLSVRVQDFQTLTAVINILQERRNMETFADYDLPTPKFKKGDRVFTFYNPMKDVVLPCPDCGDVKEVHVVFPDGRELTADCPRCGTNNNLDYRDLPPLKYKDYGVEIRVLTIGLIKINDYGDVPISYMCTETGIGSGSVFYEDKIFASSEEAAEAGSLKATELNSKIEQDPNILYTKHINRLNIRDAFIESHRSQMFKSWYHVHNLVSGIGEVLKDNEDRSKSELVESLENAMRYDFDYDTKNHPLTARLAAAEALVKFFQESIVDGTLVHRWPQQEIEKWRRAVTESTLQGVNDGED